MSRGMNRIVFFVFLCFALTALQAKAFDRGDEDCESSTEFLRRSGLACVACGIEKHTGMKPSERWLGFLGLSAQEHSNTDFAGRGNTDQKRRNFLKNVIQKVQAYGFCLENEIDVQGRLTDKTIFPSMKGKQSSELYGAITGSLNSDGKRPRLYRQFFGLPEDSTTQAIAASDHWTTLFPEERRALLSSRIDNLVGRSAPLFSSDSAETVGMKKCLRQIKTLQQKNKDFQLSGPNKKDGLELCSSMAKSCNVNHELCEPKQNQGPTAPGVTTPRPSLFNATPSRER